MLSDKLEKAENHHNNQSSNEASTYQIVNKINIFIFDSLKHAIIQVNKRN